MGKMTFSYPLPPPNLFHLPVTTSGPLKSGLTGDLFMEMKVNSVSSNGTTQGGLNGHDGPWM